MTTTVPPGPVAFRAEALTERLRALRDTLKEDLIERDDAVRLALLAALAGEHLLLVGPPGTAKSLVARRLRLAFADDRYFERLLTRFTVPEELFGPLSIKGLEEDRYVRQTAGYLPTASIAFLDEIFKANSAILNALLTLLNEREFDNGNQRQKTPLVAVIGASNELPEGEELDALYDRFLVRLHVGAVSEQGFESLLALRGEPSPAVDSRLRLTAADIEAVRTVSQNVSLAPEVQELLKGLRTFCAAEGIAVSDRRWRKVVKLLQTSAATHGRNEVSIWDCWLLQHCVWHEPEQRQKVYDWYAERVGASRVMDPSALTRIVRRFELQLENDKTATAQARDRRGRLLYRGENDKPTIKSGGRRRAKRGNANLFLAPAGAAAPNYYGRPGEPAERTNQGRGFTEDDLDKLVVPDSRGYHADFKDWSERSKYLRDENNWHYESAKNRELIEPLRHKRAYVEQQAGEVHNLANQVAAYRRDFERHLNDLQDTVTSHLWLDPAFREPATLKLRQSGIRADQLAARVQTLLDGFRALPLEQDLPELGDEKDPAEDALVDAETSDETCEA